MDDKQKEPFDYLVKKLEHYINAGNITMVDFAHLHHHYHSRTTHRGKIRKPRNFRYELNSDWIIPNSILHLTGVRICYPRNFIILGLVTPSCPLHSCPASKHY